MPGNVLQEFADKISKQAMENMEEAMAAGAVNGSGNDNLNPVKTGASIPVAASTRPAANEPGTVVAGKV
jgi:hypothetical protein